MLTILDVYDGKDRDMYEEMEYFLQNSDEIQCMEEQCMPDLTMCVSDLTVVELS